MIEKNDHTVVPKKLHAIWLGGILKEAGKKNIAEWKAKNPDYEANVWIDSSTYLVDDSPEAIKQKEEYEQFKEWAKNNRINIIDINPNATDPDPAVLKRPELFKGMNSAQFYLDELKDPGSNYAAASDILRAEILYHDGGVYFDAEDVFPNKPLGQLNAPQGILVHSFGSRDFLNNDVIASIPKGERIGRFRDVIQKNYEELYSKDKRYLIAHRFSNLFSFRTEKGDRKSSTISISGPGALRKIVGYEPEKQLKFPSVHFEADQQALSWLDNNFNTIEKVAPYFRLNLIEYFNVVIENYAYNSTTSTETRKLLNRFQDAINSHSPSTTMIELLNHVKPLFTEQEIALINGSANNLFSTFENHANQAEEFLLYCKHGNVKPEHLYGFIKGRSAYYYNKESLQEGLTHPYNILHFFHDEFSKGFFEIIKLREVPMIDYRTPWKYSFSGEEQKQLTEHVENDMKRLRSEEPTVSVLQSEQKETPQTPQKQQAVTQEPGPASLKQESLSNNPQEKAPKAPHAKQVQAKISLMNTYPYGKKGPGRSHMAPVHYNGVYKNYKGDALKRIILDDFKKKIEHCSTIKDLNSLIKVIVASDEFEVLKTPQRMTSAILGLKTSAIEAFEGMLNDAVTQIKEKNNTKKLQDEALISLEDDFEITDKENSNPNNLLP